MQKEGQHHEQRRHYLHGSQDAQLVLHAASRLFDWPLDGLFDLGASMTQEDIIRMAQESQMPFYWRTGEITYLDKLERFAALVASAERERIKQANAPEIERINAYIKEALAQQEQPPYHHFVSDRFNIDLQTGNLNIGAVKKQEPVAWISPKELLVIRGNAYAGAKDWRVNLGLEPEDGDVGLYTIPPQRTWVGLTDEERQDIALEVPIDAVSITEAKLKEKNT